MPRCKVCSQEMEYTGEGGNPSESMYVCINKECGFEGYPMPLLKETEGKGEE